MRNHTDTTQQLEISFNPKVPDRDPGGSRLVDERSRSWITMVAPLWNENRRNSKYSPRRSHRERHIGALSLDLRSQVDLQSRVSGRVPPHVSERPGARSALHNGARHHEREVIAL